MTPNLMVELSNVKRQKVVKFANKHNEKRIASFAGFVAKLQQSVSSNEKYFIYYATKKVLAFAQLLRENGIIQNFYVMTAEDQRNNFGLYLSPSFDARLLVIHLKSEGKYASALSTFRMFTIPSRQVSINHNQLLEKTLAAGAATLYVLNTPKGLLTHSAALHSKIGGEVVCEIQ